MANTISPNMSLIVPGVGTEPGPTWASDLNADLGILDQHNHSAGQGVQITPNGLNINADLSIESNNLTFVKTVNFAAQVGDIPAVSPNLGCIYVAGNELVYNDEIGNIVTITNNGAVNSGAGSITGLPSGTASASYSSINQTFVWQSSTSTPANMDFGSAILRNIVANSKGLTLNPPAAMAADITITLPTPPGSTSFLTMDSSGNIGTSSSVSGATLVDHSVTQVKLALMTVGQTVGAGGYALSPSSGTFVTSSTSPVNVTNLSVTITTTGRPVMIGLIADGTTSVSEINVADFSSIAAVGNIILMNGGTQLVSSILETTVAGPPPADLRLAVPPSVFSYIDTPVAGTYMYQIQAVVSSNQTAMGFVQISLYAYEI